MLLALAARAGLGWAPAAAAVSAARGLGPLAHAFSTSSSTSSSGSGERSAPRAAAAAADADDAQQQRAASSAAAGPSGADNSSASSQQPQQQQPLSQAFVAGRLSQEELWLAGLPHKIKFWAAGARPHLKGRESEVVEAVRSDYYDLMARHAAGRALSHQARRQLKIACLAAATYRALLRETGGDAAAADEHVAQSMGSLYAPFLRGALKGLSWVKRLLLAQKPYALALGTLRDIEKDMEGACSCRIDEPAPGARAALTVDACMFHEVLSAEGEAHLLKHLCCQHNAHWLDAYRGHGVEGGLEACMARGDAKCAIGIRAGGGGGGGGGSGSS